MQMDQTGVVEMKPHIAIRQFNIALREWGKAEEELSKLDDAQNVTVTHEDCLGYLRAAYMHMGMAHEIIRELLNASETRKDES